MMIVAGLMAVSAGTSRADRFGATADPELGHTLDASYSYGFIFDRDAEFWGPSLSYAGAIGDRWGYSLSLPFDQETENRNDGTRKTVHTFSGIATVYWLVNDRISLSAGFAKGFADDDNSTGSLRFKSGSWSTGLALGYTLYEKGAFSANVSTSLEYNISEREWGISWDLGIGYSF